MKVEAGSTAPGVAAVAAYLLPRLFRRPLCLVKAERADYSSQLEAQQEAIQVYP